MRPSRTFAILMLLTLSAPAAAFTTWLDEDLSPAIDSITKVMPYGGAIFLGGHQDFTFVDTGHIRVEKRDLATGIQDPVFNGGSALSLTYVAGTVRCLTIQAGALYVGMASASGIRVEKRSPLTGALDPAFGDGGAIERGLDVVSEPEFRNVAIGEGAIYILGETSPVLGQTSWLVYKFDAATGLSATAFGVNGTLTVDLSIYDDWLDDAVISGGQILLIGTRSSMQRELFSPEATVLQKRDAVSGALLTGFGSGGSVELPYAKRLRWPLLNGDALYAAPEYGFYAASTWDVIKLSWSTGLADPAFGRDGTLCLLLGNDYNYFGGMVLDGQDLFVAGEISWIAGDHTQLSALRLDAATGALRPGFGDDGDGWARTDYGGMTHHLGGIPFLYDNALHLAGGREARITCCFTGPIDFKWIVESFPISAVTAVPTPTPEPQTGALCHSPDHTVLWYDTANGLSDPRWIRAGNGRLGLYSRGSGEVAFMDPAGVSRTAGTFLGSDVQVAGASSMVYNAYPAGVGADNGGFVLANDLFYVLYNGSGNGVLVSLGNAVDHSLLGFNYAGSDPIYGGYGLTAAPDGSLWMNSLQGTFDHYSGAGAYLGSVTETSNAQLRLAASSTAIYGVGYDSVVRAFSLSGTPLWTAGGYGSGLAQLQDPWDIAVYGGVVYVVDHGQVTVKAYRASDGAHLGNIGSYSYDPGVPGAFQEPTSVTAYDGKLYVADAGSNDVVHIFDLCGGASSSPTPSATASPSPAGSPSATPTMTATASPSGMPSATRTATPSATATLSRSPTVGTTATPSASVTAQGTASATPSPSATPGSAGASSTATPSPGGASATATPSSSAIAGTPSATPNPPTPTPTRTPSAGAAPTAINPTLQAQVVAVALLNNPNPRAIRVNVNGNAAAVRLRVYNAAGALVVNWMSGPMAAGWNNVPVPADFQFLNPGVYFMQINGQGSDGIWAPPRRIRFYWRR